MCLELIFILLAALSLHFLQEGLSGGMGGEGGGLPLLDGLLNEIAEIAPNGLQVGMVFGEGLGKNR